jgi:hypothetical protein
MTLKNLPNSLKSNSRLLSLLEDKIKQKGIVVSDKPVTSTQRCSYLKQSLDLDQLKKIAKSLDVNYGDNSSFSDICEDIEMKRPDLMRGRVWNIIRALLSNYDIQSEGGLHFLKHLLSTLILNILSGGMIYMNPYSLYEMITYFQGDTNSAVGHAKYALQRRDVRKLLEKYKNVNDN